MLLSSKKEAALRKSFDREQVNFHLSFSWYWNILYGREEERERGKKRRSSISFVEIPSRGIGFDTPNVFFRLCSPPRTSHVREIIPATRSKSRPCFINRPHTAFSLTIYQRPRERERDKEGDVATWKIRRGNYPRKRRVLFFLNQSYVFFYFSSLFPVNDRGERLKGERK